MKVPRLLPQFQPQEVRDLIKPVRARVRVAVVLTTAATVSTAIGMASIGKITADLLNHGSASSGWLTIVAAALICGFGLRIAADSISHRADADLALHLRERLAEALEYAPFSWFMRHPSGKIRRVVADDVTTLHHLVAHSYNDLTAALVAPVVAAILIAILDVKLLVVLAVPVAISWWIAKRMAAVNAAKMPGYGAAASALSSEITEFLTAAPVLKSYGHSGTATKRFTRADASFVEFFLSWARPLIKPETAQSQIVSPVVLLALVLASSTMFITAGWSEPANVVAVLLLGLSVSQPLSAISDNSRSLAMARRAATNVQSLLDDVERGSEKDHESDASAGASFPDQPELSLNQVGLEIDGNLILQDLSVTIPAGIVVGIVGPSGAGKTTLARILAGLLQPTSGAIHVGGTPLQAISSDERRRHIGYVAQNSRLLNASIAENVALDQEFDIARVESALSSVAASDIVQDLHDHVHSVFGDDFSLSGGQQQRVALGRVAFSPPRILILDEPTARIDIETEAAVQRGLSAVTHGSSTTIVISHRLQATASADLLLVMDRGSVVQRGTHTELLGESGLYQQLWEAQR